MKTKIITIAILVLGMSSIYAQNTADALRFSQTFNGGTARFVSMGGAFGALGGDFTTLTYNPAGLGIYRTSEFSFTPSFKSVSINSTYNGVVGEDSRTRFYFDNVGFVMSFKPSKTTDEGLINFNLGFGYNRTNDFFTSSYAAGENDQNSIMDYFAGLTNNSNSFYDDLSATDDYNPFLQTNAPWESIMAWNTYLIDTAETGGGYEYTPALLIGDKVYQQNATSTSGSGGEYVISFATNISNKLFFGATMGINSFMYSQSATYSEIADPANGILPNGDRFYSLDYGQTYEINGTGYNLKIGTIYKPIEGLRLGLALHTPTYFKFSDTYSYTMYSDFEYGTSDSNTPNSRYDYNFETPMKFIGSIAYVFKDFGLISFDYERVDFSRMRFREGGDGDNFIDINQAINDNYDKATNLRIGGEIKLGEVLLRAGYATYGSPFKSGTLNEKSKHSIVSGGLGYRSGNFFMDAAYMREIASSKYIFYNLGDGAGNSLVNPVSTDSNQGKLLVTLGFKF